jgi:FixJ family two-component response regulator
MISKNNSNGHHIFFTDDEPKICRVIEEILEQNGLKVSCFGCPVECIEELQVQRCDLLITDLKMPKMDGIDLMRETKQLNPLLPVLIITGYGDIPTAVEAIKAGATDFIEKPLDKRSFVSKVRSLLPENGNRKHLDQTLTQAEEKVQKLVLDGKSNREIAMPIQICCNAAEYYSSGSPDIDRMRARVQESDTTADNYQKRAETWRLTGPCFKGTNTTRAIQKRPAPARGNSPGSLQWVWDGTLARR